MRDATDLDWMDFKILTVLQDAGRASNVEVADAVGLSPSPCLARIKRLQAIGVITGYGAQLSLATIGKSIVVFVEITIGQHRRSELRRFEEAVATLPEVMECYNVSGGYDYLMKVITRDTAHFQKLMEKLLDAEIGVERFKSYVVLRQPLAKTKYPLGVLFQGGES